MSGPLTVPFAIAALFVSQILAKILFAVLALVCGGASSYSVWRREREALLQERARNQKPELKGGIISVGATKVTDNRCRVQIKAWVRNERHVASSARITDASLCNLQGEAYPSPVYVPQVRADSDLMVLLRKRLEYGERIEGLLDLVIDVPEANFNTTVATVTIADDFDQTTVLVTS